MNENEEKRELSELVEKEKHLRKISHSRVHIIIYALSVIGMMLYIFPLLFDMPLFQTEITTGLEVLPFLEATSKSFSIDSMPSLWMGIGIPLFLMTIGTIINTVTIRDKDWKLKKNRFLFTFICFIASVCTAAICWYMAGDGVSVEYNLGVTSIEYSVKCNLAMGAILSIIGLVLWAGASLIQCVVLYYVARGRISEHVFDFGFGSEVSKYEKSEDKSLSDIFSELIQHKPESKSLTDKLSELMKLKSEGIITEEEFQSKKEELLKKFE